MKNEIKIALMLPTLFTQLALAHFAKADCRDAYAAAINQPSVVQNIAGAAAGASGVLAVSGIVAGTAVATVPAGIIGVGASATSYTNHMHREHLAETLAMIDDALLGSGMSLNELAQQTGHMPEEVASVIRELNESNRLCGDRLLLGDETRLLVTGILSSNANSTSN